MISTQNKSLWHLGNEYETLVSQLYDPETGEVNEVAQAQLDNLAPTIEQKCIAIASHLRKLESEEREIERLQEEIASRKSAYRHEINRRLDYLKKDMERCGVKEIKCPYFTLKIKKNPWSTEIIDETQIPEAYMATREIIKTERKPDKEAIKKHFEVTGSQMPGTWVSQKTTLKISVDKL